MILLSRGVPAPKLLLKLALAKYDASAALSDPSLDTSGHGASVEALLTRGVLRHESLRQPHIGAGRSGPSSRRFALPLRWACGTISGPLRDPLRDRDASDCAVPRRADADPQLRPRRGRERERCRPSAGRSETVPAPVGRRDLPKHAGWLAVESSRLGSVSTQLSTAQCSGFGSSKSATSTGSHVRLDGV
ncbi:hypothetical protein EMIHUDRAFT_212566 [Emiliania huxleyi CCMP1516]|uniref:Uncharacterized protein n=2 Tax=Emiliania huxleyi TaxID=2903 RepID=A0A0D3IQF2_EMIH1|nr:hypothetical protein EMIHUDRAFT_212566 [Emiliania huxleyi CCMP1516]EOD13487.1 hypothetical protein EMIHUDRAFT_212566 [Emiliania huxleyi CCMP1516]|eukprot:XP_005765916.1 hypothetical protein EMIHUDRAFT_212566 [Emiliania huxleyi CCMP1516]